MELDDFLKLMKVMVCKIIVAVVVVVVFFFKKALMVLPSMWIQFQQLQP